MKQIFFKNENLGDFRCLRMDLPYTKSAHEHVGGSLTPYKLLKGISNLLLSLNIFNFFYYFEPNIILKQQKA